MDVLLLHIGIGCLVWTVRSSLRWLCRLCIPQVWILLCHWALLLLLNLVLVLRLRLRRSIGDTLLGRGRLGGHLRPRVHGVARGGSSRDATTGAVLLFEVRHGVGRRVRQAKEVADVGEGGDEEQHDEGADAREAAQHVEGHVRGDAHRIVGVAAAQHVALPAVDGAAVARARGNHAVLEGRARAGRRAHGGQPEDDQQAVERQRRPRVVARAAPGRLLGQDVVERDDPGEDDLLSSIRSRVSARVESNGR